MTTVYLEKITIGFPGSQAGFNAQLIAILAAFGRRTSSALEVTASDPNLFPRLSIDAQSPRSVVHADFLLSSGETETVEVENATGVRKLSPHAYQRVGIDEVARRLAAAGLAPAGVDHLGINLPWFEAGAHPRILQLRKNILAACLYHRYPTGEPWDFILPGSPDEIAGRTPVDYNRVRRPKFELVSFEKASTPIVQIDLAVTGRYEDFSGLFPEALADPAFRNIWVYLENPHPIDICLVINEPSEGDWSGFFTGCRLQVNVG
jgi:hypothetical protein